MDLLIRVSSVLARFSFIGLLFGGLFFALSLTPSLIPRGYVFQGVLAGFCLAIGYGVGVFLRWLWWFLEMPQPPLLLQRIFDWLTSIFVGVVILRSLWLSANWQNSIRELMGMDPLTTAHPIRVAVIALVVGLALVAAGSLIGRLIVFAHRRLERIVPRRISAVLSVAIVGLLLINLANGVIVRSALRAADASYQQLDRLIDDGIAPPDIDLLSGSANSLIEWDDLGRAGREFVVTGPSQEDLAGFSDGAALQPIRTFVGLNSAKTAEERAELALAELKRVDAFSRAVMVVITPTGTGWIDPMASDTLEYIYGGDTAMVAVQYSYLTSYLSLLVEPQYAQRSAQALFQAVYNHWTTLPEDERPELYLHGLSLGALGSQASLEIYDLLDDPIQGALWSGPPFSSALWRSVTDGRNKGTPAWLPRFRDGSLFRFTNQQNELTIVGETWGPLRLVYLQYASDPIVFFDMQAAFRRPAWMIGERGPDVSPQFTWYPIVTFVQLLLDMATALAPPIGYGHTYAPDNYIDAWVAVTNPDGWSEADTNRLKARFAGAGTAE